MLTVITSISVVAQTNYVSGFIVTLEGDSLSVLVDSRGAIRNAHLCAYKKDFETKRVEYLPGEIKAYGFVDGKYYVSKNVVFQNDSTTLFLEYLINGIVDVYAYRDINDDYYFIEKEGMKITMLDDKDQRVKIDGKDYMKKNNQYIGILKYTFNESPEIQKKSEKLTLNHSNLIKIAKDYHGYVCEGEECIVYEKRKSKVKFGIEALVGLDFHTLNYEGNVKSNIDYSFGLIGSMNLPWLNDNIGVNLLVKYGKYDVSSKVENFSSPTSGTITSRYSEGNNLMNNLYFSYTFPQGMFRPVFLVGFSYSIFINPKDIEVLTHTISEEYVNFSYKTSEVMESSFMGFVVGAGLDIPVYKDYKVSAIVQYNFMKDTGVVPIYDYNPLSIILGFKL